MKTLNVYGVEMTTLQEMKFSKHVELNGIAMNTKTKEERKKIASDWLKSQLTLKEQLKEALNLPDENFDFHESDLYVKDERGAFNWLKANHPQPNIIKKFYSHKDRKIWIEIPFGYMVEDMKKKGIK